MKLTQAKAVRPMRDIVNLLESNASAERISDYPFRSAGEVSAYLHGLEKQMTTAATLERVAVPLAMPKAPDFIEVSPVVVNIEDLDRLQRMADDAQNRLDILTSLEVSVNYNFRDQRNRLLGELESVRKRVTRERDKALDAMGAFYRLAPAVAQQMMSDIVRVARVAADGYCTATDEFVCASPFYTSNGPTGVRFCTYLKMTDLCSNKNPDDGFTYPTYFVLVSAVVTRGNRLRMFVNTLHDFALPSTANLGECFLDTAKGTEALNALLSEDSLAARATVPLSVGRSQIRVKRFSANKYLRKVMLDKKANKLVFTMKPDLNPDHVGAITEQLVRDTHSLLRPMAGHNLVYEVKNSKPCQIHFKLTPASRAPARKISEDQYRLLSDKLGMSGDEIQALQKILYRGA
jgi:hypothetical protein